MILQLHKIDALVHNTGQMLFGPTEAFMPEQLPEQYHIDLPGKHRINRVFLPHMRKARSGLLVWSILPGGSQ